MDELIANDNFLKYPHCGFNELQLKYLSQNIPSTLSEIYWPHKAYSLSSCYRLMIKKWPKLIPLPFFTDHGIDLRYGLQKHDLYNDAKLHVAWNRYREPSNKIIGEIYNEKKIIFCCNPWVYFRRVNNIQLSNNAMGTLVFFPHSNHKISCDTYNIDKYINDLNDLPKKYHPIVICLHSHDLNGGIYNRLRHLSCRIVSAGNNLSGRYINRFYNLIRNFEYATSPNGNTDLFLSHEMGLKYFIFGDRPIFDSEDDVELGPMQQSIAVSDLDIKKLQIFSQFPPQNNIIKTNFVNYVLGVEFFDKGLPIIEEVKFKDLIIFMIRPKVWMCIIINFMRLIKSRVF